MRISIYSVRQIIFVMIFFIASFLALSAIFSHANTFMVYFKSKVISADVKDYEKIFRIRPPRQNKPVEFRPWFQKHSDKVILEFAKFIEKYPNSDLVAEAKLRIAERYEISWRKENALSWLNNIIKHHPDDKYYSVVRHGLNGEWTAAWALYYRYVWFSRPDKKDLEAILEKYSDSQEVVRNAKRLLKEN